MKTRESAPQDTHAIDAVSDPGRWWALAFLSMGVTMVMIDATIVNVAVPQISSDLSARPTDVEWINSIYALVFASLLITMGRAGDLLGRRRLFTEGAVLFVLASLVAATAQSPEILIAGRALQGIGGAMLVPSTLSLVNARFRGRDRGTAFAVWGVVIGLVAAVGPLLGGWLTTTFSWRWAFGINVPIAAIAIIGTLVFTPESKDDTSQRGIDLPGVVLSAIGFGALVFALIEGQRYGWWLLHGDRAHVGPMTWPSTVVSPIPAALALSVVALALFVWNEAARARHGRVVVLDLTLFKIRTFTAGNIAGLVIMFGEFGMILTLPLFLQNVLGYTALRAGVTVALIALGGLIGAITSARLTRIKGPLFVLRLGLMCEIVGMIGVGATYAPDAEQTAFIPWLLLFGIGLGFANAQLVNLILGNVPVSKSGQASGTQSTSRQIGTALGVAVLGAVVWASFGTVLNQQLANIPGGAGVNSATVREAIVESTGTVINSPDVSNAQRLDTRFGPQVQAAAQDAYSVATARATYVGAFFVTISLLATLAMPRARRREDESGAAPQSAPVAGTAAR